jgi:hypothetical protein
MTNHAIGWRSGQTFRRRATEAPLPIFAGQVFEHRREPLWPRYVIAFALLALLIGIWPR